jgi:pimeloyl-ACP methyl ester carboxylesterase
MVHYMGLGGMSGWAHHFIQSGYKVYLVDRPGHGRSPYHPDALGEIGPLVTYDLLTRDTVTSGANPEQAVARHQRRRSVIRSSISSSRRRTRRRATRSWRSRSGNERRRARRARRPVHPDDALGRRPFGWLVANEKPNLVKAVVSFEGATRRSSVLAAPRARRCRT